MGTVPIGPACVLVSQEQTVLGMALSRSQEGVIHPVVLLTGRRCAWLCPAGDFGTRVWPGVASQAAGHRMEAGEGRAGLSIGRVNEKGSGCNSDPSAQGRWGQGLTKLLAGLTAMKISPMCGFRNPLSQPDHVRMTVSTLSGDHSCLDLAGGGLPQVRGQYDQDALHYVPGV